MTCGLRPCCTGKIQDAKSDFFRAYVGQVLAPTLDPGDVAVMDNLGAHKVDGIRSAIEARGATLMNLKSAFGRTASYSLRILILKAGM